MKVLTKFDLFQAIKGETSRLNFDVATTTIKIPVGFKANPTYVYGYETGNELQSIATGEKYSVENVAVYSANFLKFLQNIPSAFRRLEPVQIDASLVVAIESSAVIYFSPICKTHRELCLFIADIENNLSDEHTQLKIEMTNLAVFLYENNPERKDEFSCFDLAVNKFKK